MKAVISGYYGFDNVGDEAVLKALIIGLRSKFPSCRITVLSASPRETSEMHGVSSIYRYDLLAIMKTLFRSDILISGGGTLLQDVTSGRSLWYYLCVILLAKLLGKKAVILGQGFGPVRKTFNQWLVRAILDRIDLIALRDEDSFTRLRSVGIEKTPIAVTGDLTGLLRSLDPVEGKKLLKLEGIPDNKPLLGVSVRNMPHDAGLEEKIFQVLAETLDHFVQKYDYFPVLILFQCPQDIQQASKVIGLMREKAAVIFRICRTEEMLSLVSQLDLLIGMRLHSVIFGVMNSVPTLGLSYDPKVESFLKMVEQPCVKLDQEISSEKLIKPLLALLANKERVKLALSEHKDQLRQKAEKNFTLLAGLFNPPEKVVDFSGVKVDNVDIDEALRRFDEMMRGKGGMIVTPNPEMIVASQGDENLKNVLNGSQLRVPDGISMVVVSRILRHPLKERVTGIDLMLKIIEISAQKGYRVFFLGGAPGVAEEAASSLSQRFPKLLVAGTYHGYFKEGDDLEVTNKIRQSGAEILFAGLGAGRQEKWLNRHLNDMGIKVGMCVGGSFDVISGRKKRAPLWIQKLCIEWLYRLITEPQRWKRQLALPRFLWLMFLNQPKQFNN